VRCRCGQLCEGLVRSTCVEDCRFVDFLLAVTLRREIGENIWRRVLTRGSDQKIFDTLALQCFSRG
jgi:hypothetical protein